MADDVIDLKKMFRAKSGQVSWNAKDLVIDLSAEKLLEQAAVKAAERYKKAIEDSTRTPKPSTIKRRGPGALWRVSGRFLSSIRAVVQGRGRSATMSIVGKLSPTVANLLPRAAKAVAKEVGEQVARKMARKK